MKKQSPHQTAAIGLHILWVTLLGYVATEILRPEAKYDGDTTEVCLETFLVNSLDFGEPSDESSEDSSRPSPDGSGGDSTVFDTEDGDLGPKPPQASSGATPPAQRSRRCYSVLDPNPVHIRFQLKSQRVRRFSVPLSFNRAETVFSVKHDFNSVFSNEEVNSRWLARSGQGVLSPSSHRSNQCPVCLKNFSNLNYRNFHLARRHVALGHLEFDLNILSFVGQQAADQGRLSAQLGEAFSQEDRVYLCRKVLATFSELEIDCSDYFGERLRSENESKVPMLFGVLMAFIFILLVFFIAYGIFLVTEEMD